MAIANPFASVVEKQKKNLEKAQNNASKKWITDTIADPFASARNQWYQDKIDFEKKRLEEAQAMFDKYNADALSSPAVNPTLLYENSPLTNPTISPTTQEMVVSDTAIPSTPTAIAQQTLDQNNQLRNLLNQIVWAQKARVNTNQWDLQEWILLNEANQQWLIAGQATRAGANAAQLWASLALQNADVQKQIAEVQNAANQQLAWIEWTQLQNLAALSKADQEATLTAYQLEQQARANAARSGDNVINELIKEMRKRNMTTSPSTTSKTSVPISLVNPALLPKVSWQNIILNS